jgi:hypothetical protein
MEDLGGQPCSSGLPFRPEAFRQDEQLPSDMPVRSTAPVEAADRREHSGLGRQALIVRVSITDVIEIIIMDTYLEASATPRILGSFPLSLFLVFADSPLAATRCYHSCPEATSYEPC